MLPAIAVPISAQECFRFPAWVDHHSVSPLGPTLDHLGASYVTNQPRQALFLRHSHSTHARPYISATRVAECPSVGGASAASMPQRVARVLRPESIRPRRVRWASPGVHATRRELNAGPDRRGLRP